MTATASRTKILKRADLYYQMGSSDKEYHAYLEKVPQGFKVWAEYGRRGNALQDTVKGVWSNQLVAELEWQKLVRSKELKGYRNVTNVTALSAGKAKLASYSGPQQSPYLPMLLTPITDHDAALLIKDTAWGAQQKFDGVRQLLYKDLTQVRSINRKGQYIAGADAIWNSARGLSGAFLLDGEAVGDNFYAFDLLELNGTDLRSQPYQQRYAQLRALLSNGTSNLHLAYLAQSAKEKGDLFLALQEAGREGIVFKKLDEPYRVGRAKTACKYKFYETASVRVAALNEQRSIAIELLDGVTWVAVGNCTIPPNHELPQMLDIVEVRYLYAYKGGSLYQPVYLGKREDLVHDDCILGQLKYKTED